MPTAVRADSAAARRIVVGADGTLYAGTSDGLYVSANNGNSWFPSDGLHLFAVT